jgi:hypothetical protein
METQLNFEINQREAEFLIQLLMELQVGALMQRDMMELPKKIAAQYQANMAQPKIPQASDQGDVTQ